MNWLARLFRRRPVPPPELARLSEIVETPGRVFEVAAQDGPDGVPLYSITLLSGPPWRPEELEVVLWHAAFILACNAEREGTR